MKFYKISIYLVFIVLVFTSCEKDSVKPQTQGFDNTTYTATQNSTVQDYLPILDSLYKGDYQIADKAIIVNDSLGRYRVNKVL